MLGKLQNHNKNKLTDLLRKCRYDDHQQIIKNTCNQLVKKNFKLWKTTKQFIAGGKDP